MGRVPAHRGKPTGTGANASTSYHSHSLMARELDLYGNAIAGDSSFIPFLYQGQYYDEERGIMFYMRVTM